MSATLKWCALWALLFGIGLLAGYLLRENLAASLMPSISLGLGLGEKIMQSHGAQVLGTLLLFGKNSSVALLCAALGRPSRGFVPATVCVTNGVVVGFLAALLALAGVAVWRFALALAPHGVIEIPALILACAIGMAALPLKARLKQALVPIGMLFVAACVEAWVSPIVANQLIS